MLRLSPTPDQDAKRWKNKNYIKLQRSPRVIIFNLVRWLLSNAIPPCNLISVKVRQHFLYQTLGRRRHNSPFNPRQIRRRSSTFFSVLTHPKVPGVFFIFFLFPKGGELATYLWYSAAVLKIVALAQHSRSTQLWKTCWVHWMRQRITQRFSLPC